MSRLRLGTVVAVLKAYEEAPMLSAPAYRGQFIARLEEVERSALISSATNGGDP